MQLQDFIVNNLLSSDTAVNFNNLNKYTPVKGRKEILLPQVNVEGKKYERIILPRKACEFIVTTDFAPGVVMFLKTFSFPEAGVKYSMDEESIWFPKPSISVQEMTLSGYIQRDISNTFFRWYERQFNSGLLSIIPGPSITISAFQVWEDFDANSDILAGAHAFVSGILSSAGLSASAAAATVSATGIVEDAMDSAEVLKEKLKVREGGMIESLFTLNNCKISYPKLVPDPSSNDFAVLETTVVYTSFESHF